MEASRDQNQTSWKIPLIPSAATFALILGTFRLPYSQENINDETTAPLTAETETPKCTHEIALSAPEAKLPDRITFSTEDPPSSKEEAQAALNLQTVYSLYVQVLDINTSEPIKGVNVKLRDPKNIPDPNEEGIAEFAVGFMNIRESTNSEGKAYLELTEKELVEHHKEWEEFLDQGQINTVPKNFSLIATHIEYKTIFQTGVNLEILPTEAESHTIVLYMERGPLQQVQIIETESGEPISGVQLEFGWMHNQTNEYEHYYARTNKDGEPIFSTTDRSTIGALREDCSRFYVTANKPISVRLTIE